MEKESTQSSFGSSYKYSYHKTTGHRNEIFFQGEHSFSDYFRAGTGFSTAFHSLPERFYLALDLTNLPSFLRYRINFLNRDFPDYEIRENSINPTITLLTKYIELELGVSFRFIEALGQNFTIQTLYRLQWNILRFKHYDLTFRMSNFDLFRSDNITALYYTLENRIKIGKFWVIEADIGLHDAGQIAFSSFFTSFYGRIGFRYYL